MGSGGWHAFSHLCLWKELSTPAQTTHTQKKTSFNFEPVPVDYRTYYLLVARRDFFFLLIVSASSFTQFIKK